MINTACTKSSEVDNSSSTFSDTSETESIESYTYAVSSPTETKDSGVSISEVSENTISTDITTEPDETSTMTTAKSTVIPSSMQTDNSNKFEVPVVNASVQNNGVLVTWNKITHTSLIGYRVVASLSDRTPEYPEDGYYAWITDLSMTSCFIKDGAKYSDGDFISFTGGSSYFFSVTAVYGNDSTKIAGNSVQVAMPLIPKALGTHPGVNLNEPVVSVESVFFSWDKTDDEIGFLYYYLNLEIIKEGITYGTGREIYDPSQTSWTKSISDLVAGSGTYSFKVTTVYSEFGETYYGLSEVKVFEIP